MLQDVAGFGKKFEIISSFDFSKMIYIKFLEKIIWIQIF